MDVQLLLFPEILEWEKEKKLEELEKNKERFNAQKIKARKNYDANELAFQEAQEDWAKTESPKSWAKMFTLIQLAVFNCINKKLCKKIKQEEIEQKALDVTMNIANNILNKKANGEFWEILKLSSFVHMPCMAIYQEQIKFEESILDESAYTFYDSDGNEIMKESEESYMDNGIFHISRY